MKLQITVLLISIIFISAKCRRNNDLPFDPCKEKVAFKADFTIEEKIGDTSIVTNKALAPGYVFFKAKGEYDSVRWLIGGPQNTSTRLNHVLYFQQPEGDVEVTMIGYRKPNTQCFPNDKAVDTLKKTITMLNRDQNAAIVGRYLGYNTNKPTDTFSVYINANNSVGIWQYFVKNLPKNCPGYIQVSDGYPLNIGLSIIGGHSAFKINASSTVCATVTGFGYLKNNDSLFIDYSSMPVPNPPVPFTSSGPREQLKFIGVRML